MFSISVLYYFLVFSFSVCLNGHSSGGAHAKLNDEEMFTYQTLTDTLRVYGENKPVLLLKDTLQHVQRPFVAFVIIINENCLPRIVEA